MVQLQPSHLQPKNLPPTLPRDGSLPTMYDLPSEDPEESGLPDEFHDFQPHLLAQTCQLPDRSREDYFIAKDLNLYYDREHPQWYKRPDWFLVLGARASANLQELRLGYVIWQERVSPFLVVELASPGTEDEDLGRSERKEEIRPTKWEVYEEILQVPYYVVYDRYENQLRGFVLRFSSGDTLRASQYEELTLEEGRLWLEELGLGLGLWQGSYEGVEGLWLRFYDRFGDWVSTPNERANLQQQRAILAEDERDRERQEKERERQRADRIQQEKEQTQSALEEERQKNQQLLDRLLKLGVDPESLP